MIFFKGEKASLLEILALFQRFQELSGLKLNPQKTEMLLAGYEEDKQAELTLLSGLQKGALPVRYFGFLLIFGRLSDNDCNPLV